HPCHELETGECSTMSYWTDEEAWISFIMIQSGHGLTPKNYDLVKTYYDTEQPMPVFDAEPAYEQMPTAFPVPGTQFEYHGGWMVRKRAYWSLFAGSFGHTYGHASVWCMISEKERDSWRTYSWFEALDRPGAWQIKILRDFLESRDLSQCTPSQKILTEQRHKKEDILDEHNQACINEGEFICVYFPSGGEETIDVGRLKSDDLHMWWFNPRDGQCYLQNNVTSEEPIQLTEVLKNDAIKIVTPTRGTEQDWVCVIECRENRATRPGKAQIYGEMPVPSEVKKVFPAW
ncbi:apiosidase-like domain-containing protein, partial [Bacillus solitudinis]|uniref:apiosidase-like domain-containing protein n=1 Tax=Bacillus solitudinis TaxID=2014074 RepID=UPI0018E230CF